MSKVTNMLGPQPLFNQPLSNWDVSNVTDMRYALQRSVSFDQDLSMWSFGAVINWGQMFYYGGVYSGLTPCNIRRIHDSWSVQNSAYSLNTIDNRITVSDVGIHIPASDASAVSTGCPSTADGVAPGRHRREDLSRADGRRVHPLRQQRRDRLDLPHRLAVPTERLGSLTPDVELRVRPGAQRLERKCCRN